ncbi:hypothetical protein CFP65_3666 [Kitasatospora sp. MMS16-BH015]|uniref:hypothetical protein n=1 Tax=Kitasatospora sp. MMS16-BH015 TaxID=2018025 RepID=UPI000CA10AFA|nr:hypothetical protein [Kitasatospora sp. MMS16-BH015]AUG78454.1 hypothetical protein CFP65_3666 [Kitasatospora sp. MMS16-BH015]
MNSLKGLGICIVLASLAFALTQISDVDRVLLGVSIAIIAVSLITYVASIRRKRRDRRIAGG